MGELNTKYLGDKKPVVTAGIYARYSSDMQSPDSANDQIERIKYYLRKENVRFVKFPASNYSIQILNDWVLKDEAESGKTASREGYELILAGIRKKSFQVLIVDDLSRLTRELGDQLYLYELIKFSGIELFSLCDGLSSESPNAKTMFTIKGLINDLGNEGHALRTKRGQEVRVLKGFSCGDICYGYGSKPTQTRMSGGREIPSHYEIFVNPEQATIVNLIFDLKIKGMGYSAIAKELNLRKVPSTDRGRKITGRTHNWGGTAVRKILMQEKYIGAWRWGRSSRVKDPDLKKTVRKDQPQNLWVEHHEGKEIREDLAIVHIEKWNVVHEMITKSTKIFKEKRDKVALMNEVKDAGLRGKTLLAGILRCSECGSPMLQICGSKQGYYGCWMHHRKDKTKCSNRRLINRKKVETKVAETLKAILLDPDHLKKTATVMNEKIKNRLRAAPEEIKSLERKKSEAQKEASNLLNFIMKHGDMSSTVKETLTSREQELSYIEHQIRSLKAAKVDKLLVTPYSLKAHYEELVETFQADPVVANAALKHYFHNGLHCRPSNKTLKKNHNQNNSTWYINGRVVMGTDGFKNPNAGSTIYR